jgi:hypothetical protein
VLPAPPPPLNFGRRLAHADSAFVNAARSEAGIVGLVEPVPPPPPNPPPPGNPPPPVKFTPWLLRQFAYAVNEAAPPVVVLVLFELAAFADPLLHAAKSRPRPPRTDTIVAARKRRLIGPPAGCEAERPGERRFAE